MSTTNRATISQLTNGSEATSKYLVDASNGELCAQNLAHYRIKQTNGTGTVVITYPALIPLRSPCCYLVRASLVGLAAGGNVTVLVQYFQANFIGGVFSVSAGGVIFNSASSPGDGLFLTKNPTSNAIDVGVATGGVQPNTQYTVEIDVQSAIPF